MEIEKYRNIIKSIVEKHSECDPEDREVETQIVFDCDRDRYLMFHVARSTILLVSYDYEKTTE